MKPMPQTAPTQPVGVLLKRRLKQLEKTAVELAEAVQLLKKVIASDPDQQDAHYLLFSLYKEQGETEQARKELATFEELKRKAADQDQKRMRMDSLN